MKTVSDKACGNPACCSSTGIHEGVTFGRGRLDKLGYWSKPCRPCAERWDDEHADHVAEVGDALLERGHTMEDVIQYVTNAEWLYLPAWPYN